VIGAGWRRLLIASASAFVALAAAAAAYVSWRLAPEQQEPLTSGWPAIVRVLAGDGVRQSRDGDTGRARFSEPFGLAAAADGTVYVSDAGGADRIRRITPDGFVATIAGWRPGFADGVGPEARFSTPSAVALDTDGALYVADTGNNAIRRVTPDGHVTTYAGDGTPGYRDGPAASAQFNGPIGIAIDRAGRVIVADTYNDRIRVIDRAGIVSTLAGAGGPGWTEGAGSTAQFHTPSGVAVLPSGDVIVADTGNGIIRTVSGSGVVTTPPWSSVQGLSRPVGIAVASTGDVYVTDDGGRLVEISPAGAARTLAGSSSGFRDGAGADAKFRAPTGVAIVEPGHLVVADSRNALVRSVGVGSRLGLRVPASPRIAPAFDLAAFAVAPLLWPAAPFEGPHEIAGTMGEARGEDAERFHAGVDIRVEQGTDVHAIRSGVVSSPISADAFGTLNEWLRIGGLTYVHIRVARTEDSKPFDLTRFVPAYNDKGKMVGMRVKRGARFAAGERIATVNAFNHVHLNVGWPGEEHNALALRIPQFDDTIEPTIAPNGVQLQDEGGTPLTTRVRGRIVAAGRVQIVVDAWDQSDGNRPERKLGLYGVGYQVLHADGSPVAGFERPLETQRFDQLLSDPAAASIVYAPGSGIPFYGGRRTQFLYRATSTLQEGVASQQFWDTSQLPAGDYIVRVWATDIRGNVAKENRDVPVTVVRR
jgi:sugar lactone lactonase YvrE